MFSIKKAELERQISYSTGNSQVKGCNTVSGGGGICSKWKHKWRRECYDLDMLWFIKFGVFSGQAVFDLVKDTEMRQILEGSSMKVSAAHRHNTLHCCLYHSADNYTDLYKPQAYSKRCIHRDFAVDGLNKLGEMVHMVEFFIRRCLFYIYERSLQCQCFVTIRWKAVGCLLCCKIINEWSGYAVL